MRHIIKLFEQGSVCVCGLRGTGKDMLMSNVVARRKKPYVSNIDYTHDSNFLPFELDKVQMGMNTHEDFLNGTVKKYSTPYTDGTDFYISDLGIYFPSQYDGQLSRDYPYIPVALALARQVQDAEWHFNVQSLNRAWLKLREMSQTYIDCRRCWVLFGKFVIQKVRIYDKYESALNHMLPFKVRAPLFCSPQTRTMVDLQRQTYECQHGIIKERFLFYVHCSNYNTRHFKEVLENGI